jgi:uncharacterized protein (TIGR04255 family)
MPDPFETIHYQRNFLKEVIVRVDFLSPLPGVDVALPPPIAEIAVRDFPIPEPREALHRQVKINRDGVASTEERFKEFQFHGIERTKTFTIGRQVVLAQYKTYQTYELVKAEFIRILDRVAEVFGGVHHHVWGFAMSTRLSFRRKTRPIGPLTLPPSSSRCLSSRRK